ncbi:MAG TPA: TetR family transcriptional regulator [Euzebyales bacterium]|nr:TetR family transcriptional regulator [Euzebyales bacterium]
MARTGRRPGETDTRGEILAAARRAFTANGYDGTTIRGVAADAGVDPALVHHYFGAKDDLFAAALDLPADPGVIVPRLLADGRERLGERLVTTVLTIWDAADANPVLMVLRSAASGGRGLEALRERLTDQVLRPIIAALGGPDARLRATLVGSQFVGLLVARYVIRLEPIASLTPAELGRAVGPNIDRYVNGDLGV